MDTLDTGDILLLSSNTSSVFYRVYDWFIRWFTNSDYTHTAMVLKDPTWIREDLKGLYVYESGTEPEPDAEDGKMKMGVQLTRLEEIVNYETPKVYVRRLVKGRERVTIERLKEIHERTHNTPYDWYPPNLINGALKIQPDPNEKHLDRVFCSALVCYMGVCCELFEDQDWSECSPGDLSCYATTNYIRLKEGVEYGPDEELA